MTAPHRPHADHTITLATPIRRGDTAIETITLRRPSAGELRGLSLQDLIGLDITAILTLVPRISLPVLTADEANRIDPADLAEIGGAIRDFFMTKSERQVMEAVLATYQPTG